MTIKDAFARIKVPFIAYLIIGAPFLIVCGARHLRCQSNTLSFTAITLLSLAALGTFLFILLTSTAKRKDFSRMSKTTRARAFLRMTLLSFLLSMIFLIPAVCFFGLDNIDRMNMLFPAIVCGSMCLACSLTDRPAKATLISLTVFLSVLVYALNAETAAGGGKLYLSPDFTLSGGGKSDSVPAVLAAGSVLTLLAGLAAFVTEFRKKTAAKTVIAALLALPLAIFAASYTMGLVFRVICVAAGTALFLFLNDNRAKQGKLHAFCGLLAITAAAASLFFIRSLAVPYCPLPEKIKTVSFAPCSGRLDTQEYRLFQKKVSDEKYAQLFCGALNNNIETVKEGDVLRGMCFAVRFAELSGRETYSRVYLDDTEQAELELLMSRSEELSRALCVPPSSPKSVKIRVQLLASVGDVLTYEPDSANESAQAIGKKLYQTFLDEIDSLSPYNRLHTDADAFPCKGNSSKITTANGDKDHRAYALELASVEVYSRDEAILPHRFNITLAHPKTSIELLSYIADTNNILADAEDIEVTQVILYTVKPDQLRGTFRVTTEQLGEEGLEVIRQLEENCGKPSVAKPFFAAVVKGTADSVNLIFYDVFFDKYY